jgi:hypothetical protein
MADSPTRRSLLTLPGSGLVGGCVGQDGTRESSTGTTTEGESSAATEQTLPPTVDRTPQPTGVPALFVENGAGRTVTVTLETTPASGEAFAATLTLADDGSRESETVDPLHEAGTLTVTVESREETAAYELPVQVVTVTEDGVTFGRPMP